MPMFKAQGVSASQLQMMAALSVSPWAMKPLFGVLSDVIAIGKYHKRYWMLLGCGAGVFGVFMLIIQLKVVSVTVFFFMLMHLEMIILDLLSEGKYAEIMRDTKGGSEIITFVNGCQSAGAVVAYTVVGPLADAQLFQVLFLIGLFAAVSPVAFISAGWIPELRRHSNEPGLVKPCGASGVLLIDTAKAREYGKIAIVIVFTGVCSPVLSWLTTYVSQPIGLGASFVALALCVGGAFYTCPRVIAKVVLFQVLTSAGAINIGSAMDYFYTAEEACLPGGPNFDLKYYMTYTGIVGALFSFVFMWIYKPAFGGWKFRRVILLGTLLRAASGIIDLAMIMRWNRAAGISDQAFYLFGEAVVENLIMLIAWIPSNTIIGKVCPDGFETAIYAFIAGLSNMGGIVSNLAGAVALDAVGLKTVLPDCDWSALPYLMLVGHVAIPFVVGLPAIWLLPDAYQTDHIESDGTIVPRQTELAPPTDSELENIDYN